jgi:hypothetical protein
MIKRLIIVMKLIGNDEGTNPVSIAKREGKRRNPLNWSQPDTRTSRLTDRGFTGHEHMDDFGLINMPVRRSLGEGGNGREPVPKSKAKSGYDPDLGLFLSPDPVLQDPANALNYNRYSYVLNNPLKYTDPSGYLFYYKGAWISNYKDWVSNPFGSSGGGRFESPATGGGSRRGDPRLDAYSDFVKSLGSSIDWREFYAQFGYKAKEIWKIGPNKIGVHYIDGKMEQLDFTSVASNSGDGRTYLDGDVIHSLNYNGLEQFEKGAVKYDLQDGVGIRTSALVQGYFSVDKYGRTRVSASVYSPEKNISINYVANVRLRNGDNLIGEYFLQPTGDYIRSSMYNYLGSANFTIPEVPGNVYMDIYIGYWVNDGAGAFNGTYYQNTFIMRGN